LVDAATGSHVLEHLRGSGIQRLQKVILSHSDYDHIGGLMALLNNDIAIDSVLLNADSDKETEAWRDLIFSLEDARRRGDINFSVGLSSGQISVPGLSRCKIEIVAPIPELAALGVGALDRRKRRITSNSISAGIRLLIDGRPVALLSGDMDDISLEGALAAGANLTADVFVFPHHGGHAGGSDLSKFASDFVKAVSPSYVLFSHGRSKHENPRQEAVSASVDAGAIVACTQLSKRCSEDASPTSLHLDSCYSAGRSSGSCCAGTLVLEFDGASLQHRMQSEHRVFVVENVRNAMCKRAAS